MNFPNFRSIYLFIYLFIYNTRLYIYMYIVHSESLRYNAQIAIAFACRNLPRVNRSDEFACVYLRLRVLFAINHARMCTCAAVRTVQSAKLASAMSARGNCVPVRGSARVGVDAQWAVVIACTWCGTNERWADDDDESQ